MMGLHPTYVKENYEQELQHVADELSKRKFYAGEIGIDLYWDKKLICHSSKLLLENKIQLAKEYKPIVIHCREAFDEIFEILEQREIFGIIWYFSLFFHEQALQAISSTT
jgi:TatD DNase family protein